MSETEDNLHQINGQTECKTNEEDSDDSSDQFLDCEPTEEIPEVLTEEEVERRRKESNDLKSNGNDLFREQLYEESIECYSKALDSCPKQLVTERSILYSNRSAAHRHCDRLEDAVTDANSAIDLNPNYVKAILRRAQIYRQMNEKLDDSLKDYQKVLELDPKCSEAMIACNELKIEINERNEKLKTEMMSKLKDLGNLVLRPFGLSTDNFKLTQNPETGGYSVNIENN